MKTKVLQLKNKLFSVSVNSDGTLTLLNEDFSPALNAGSIIGSLGGVEAVLLLCIETDDDFSTVIANKQSQEAIARDRIKQNTELVAKEGVRCDVGGVKFAKVGLRYFRYDQSNGWTETKEDNYLKALAKQDAYNQQLLEEDREYQCLVETGAIPVNIDNLRIVMRYLQHQNWGSWILPKMSIGYSAHQYDCDGKTAVTIKLDNPINYGGEMVSQFKYGAPHGHLSNYYLIR